MSSYKRFLKYIKKKDITFKVSNYSVDQSAWEKIILAQHKRQDSWAVRPRVMKLPRGQEIPANGFYPLSIIFL